LLSSVKDCLAGAGATRRVSNPRITEVEARGERRRNVCADETHTYIDKGCERERERKRRRGRWKVTLNQNRRIFVN